MRASAIERQPVRYSGDYDFYSREEVDALVRAAASEQDAGLAEDLREAMRYAAEAVRERELQLVASA